MAKPGEIRRLNELLEQQASQRDPFRNPRMVSARQQGMEALQPGTSPGEEAAPQVSLLDARQEAPQASLQEFITSRDPQEQGRMQQTKVPGQLQDIGLGELAEGLSFNKMGRLNLMLRLRERFGDDFFQNESARNAIAIFDRALSTDEQEQEEEMQSMFSSADRTLEELFRMDQQGVRT